MSRIFWMLVIVGLLFGCAGVDPKDNSLATSCDVAPFLSVESDSPISCDNFRANVAIAKQLMLERGWTSEAEYSFMYSQVKVTVIDTHCIGGWQISKLFEHESCLFGDTAPSYNPGYAQTEPEFAIEINHDGGALAHEMMHVYDEFRGRGDVTAKHTLWTSMGYFKYADEYAAHALPIQL